MVTHEDVIEVLRPVEDPELHRSIVDLGMVRDVVVATNSVSLTIVLTVPGCPLRNEIQRRVTDAVTSLDGIETAEIAWSHMTDEEKA